METMRGKMLLPPGGEEPSHERPIGSPASQRRRRGFTYLCILILPPLK